MIYLWADQVCKAKPVHLIFLDVVHCDDVSVDVITNLLTCNLEFYNIPDKMVSSNWLFILSVVMTCVACYVLFQFKIVSSVEEGRQVYKEKLNTITLKHVVNDNFNAAASRMNWTKNDI